MATGIRTKGAVAACCLFGCFYSLDYVRWRHYHTQPTPKDATKITRTKEVLRVPCEKLQGYDVVVRHHWTPAASTQQEEPQQAKWRPFGFDWTRSHTQDGDSDSGLMSRPGGFSTRMNLNEQQRQEQQQQQQGQQVQQEDRYASMAIAPSKGSNVPASFLSEATSQSMVKCTGSLLMTPHGTVNDPSYCKQASQVLCPTYLRVMMGAFALLPWPLPARLDIAHVGVAAGSLAMFQQRHVAKNLFSLDLVDVEPQVLRTAVDLFGLRKIGACGGLNLITADAEQFLAKNVKAAVLGKRYDVLFLDCFVGTDVPEHLKRASFLELCRQSLSPQGVVAVNLPARDPNFVRAARGVFGDLNVIEVACPHSSNVVVFAGTQLPQLTKNQLRGRCTRFSRHWQLPYDVGAHFPLSFAVV